MSDLTEHRVLDAKDWKLKTMQIVASACFKTGDVDYYDASVLSVGILDAYTTRVMYVNLDTASQKVWSDSLADSTFGEDNNEKRHLVFAQIIHGRPQLQGLQHYITVRIVCKNIEDSKQAIEVAVEETHSLNDLQVDSIAFALQVSNAGFRFAQNTRILTGLCSNLR